jgi:hypothetical protein
LIVIFLLTFSPRAVPIITYLNTWHTLSFIPTLKINLSILLLYFLQFRKNMRTNGFQKPLNGMQIATWILLPLLMSQYLIFLTPTLPKALSIPLTLAFLFTGMLSTYHGYVTTKTDPIDKLLQHHLRGSSNAEEDEQEGDDADTKYCWICQTQVHKLSMHCKYCDKCVSNFDHHCMWLNTCVGSANYDHFFKTVIWTFCFVSIHVASLIVHLSLYFLENARVRSLASSWFGDAGANIILIGFNIGFLVFTAFCAFMVLQLLVFHLGLKREKITTYQFIIRDSARKREKILLSNRIRQKRVEELEKAGNAVEAFCLKVGALGCCKPCDPVRRLVLQEMDQADTNEENGNDDRSFSDHQRYMGGGDDDDDNDEIGKQVVRSGAGTSTTTQDLPSTLNGNGNHRTKNKTKHSHMSNGGI